jgi:serine/threonine-protein kinase RsbW
VTGRVATLAIPADVRELATVRRFVRGLIDDARGPAVARDDIVQAVDESVTNVIEHGCRGREGSIEVEVTCSPMGATVRIRDDCPGFDPTTVPSPDTDAPLGERPLGGMGVHLIRVLTDGMSHRMLPGGGNELILVKSFGPGPGGERDGDHR